MVKDKGLACQFIIANKPAGTPVTDRAVPVAIFQAETSVKKHFLCKWLKDNSIIDFDIRSLLDWGYYLERFGSTVQKVITIPAAMQHISNPVPRIRHPDWLFRRVANSNDTYKQNKITDMFAKKTTEMVTTTTTATASSMNASSSSKKEIVTDIETMLAETTIHINKKSRIGGDDIAMDFDDLESTLPSSSTGRSADDRPSSSSSNATKNVVIQVEQDNTDTKDVNAAPLDMHKDFPEWLKQQKQKWKQQRANRKRREAMTALADDGGVGKLDFGCGGDDYEAGGMDISRGPATTGSTGVSDYFKGQSQSLVRCSWQVLQIAETTKLGEFKVWALVDKQLHHVRLCIPRRVYVNLKKPILESLCACQAEQR